LRVRIRAVKKRPNVEPIQPSLFALDKPDDAVAPVTPQEIVRPFEIPDTQILLGTSSFTASGWEGSFYPKGMKSTNYLSYYAKQFRTVEIDSTFYGTPSAKTVESWYKKTPADFAFAEKVPQVVTHDKVLVDCEPEFDEFIERMHLLGDKLGPMLLQFPKFDKWVLKSPDEFRARLQSFFKRAADLNAGRFAVEVRNKDWLDARLTDLLREHNVALALTDTSFMPRPWEMKQKFDLVTADFAYVRWLGDRKGIEEQTTTWDKAVIDRQNDLRSWVVVLRRLVEDKRIRKIFAFANNHYAGHAPATVKLFMDLWNDKK
jgi:uncharacterized protein YecE (DUF72 family)